MRVEKAQSAMEYLVTYAWAILIIAVVLGALFYLGVFSNNGARLQPGSCKIMRPYGPNTTQFLSRQGTCTGGLPEYVGAFSSAGAGYVSVNPRAVYSKHIAVALWVNVQQLPPSSTSPFNLRTSGNTGGMVLDLNTPYMQAYCNVAGSWYEAGSTNPFPTDKWIFIVETYDGNYCRLYINGNLNATSSNIVGVLNDPNNMLAWIGKQACCTSSTLTGDISNVQVYDASLSSNEVASLYTEGIGGTPIDLQDLVGWWPLNGNANDYSGDGINAVQSNVIFTSQYQTAGASS